MSSPVRLVPQAAQAYNEGFVCPLCSGSNAAYVFATNRTKVYRCGGCALTVGKVSLESSPDRTKIRAFTVRGRTKQHYAGLIDAVESSKVRGPILILTDEKDSVVPLIERRDYAVTTIANDDDIDAIPIREYTAAVITSTLMRVRDPLATLTNIRQLLPEGAPLFLSVPLLDGAQARLMGRNWHEWQPENCWYFTRETLHLLLRRAGFAQVWFDPERRRYSLNALSERMQATGEPTLWHSIVEALRHVSPGYLRDRQFRLPSGTAVISAVAASKPSEGVISIIVPVFNEVATLREMMDALLTKTLPGLRKEIIVVESNSNDGSRDLVRTYEGHPDVRVLLQPRPRGKGNAVREGLAAATGDIVMIQDADLEYDIDDYGGLLAPLLAWQTMFVLGTRHQGGWKMRKFNDAPLTAAVFNLGHWFFQTLMNTVLRTQMSDPFTMFKLFRRDALFGVDLVCNRFDLDIELVMKLVRKGYIPLEIPVNYIARSFAEGKKVSFFRDGLTWVWTILKWRFAPIGAGRRAAT
jgi:GT2 family glycosyltransferase